MNLDLDGKLAFVTAGAHGIGAAVADLLTAEGASVLVADVDADALAARGAAWHGTIAADLATADGVSRAVAQALDVFGRAPDILVNNLGVGQASSFEETTDESWLRSFEVNLLGCVRVCRALVPLMAARG
jgi:NAD(P)-dependent dehydrogenase (short-subunit alcohol dehydrogenase family)